MSSVNQNTLQTEVIRNRAPSDYDQIPTIRQSIKSNPTATVQVKSSQPLMNLLTDALVDSDTSIRDAEEVETAKDTVTNEDHELQETPNNTPKYETETLRIIKVPRRSHLPNEYALGNITVTTREITYEDADGQQHEERERSSISIHSLSDNAGGTLTSAAPSSTNPIGFPESSDVAALVKTQSKLSLTPQSNFLTVKSSISSSHTSSTDLIQTNHPKPTRRSCESFIETPKLQDIEDFPHEPSSGNQNEAYSLKEMLDDDSYISELSGERFHQSIPDHYNEGIHEVSDTINFDELAHRPPCVLQLQNKKIFGKSTLREMVIQRQSSRFMPPENRLVELMEEQLVRWRAPQSSFGVDDVLNGKHAYQNSTLPSLEIGSSLVPIAEPKLPTKSAFKEINSPKETNAVVNDTPESISDNGDVNYARDAEQVQSASISSSMFKSMNGTNRPTAGLNSGAAAISDIDNANQRTPDVFPLTEQEISQIAMEETTVIREVISNAIPEPNFNQLYGYSEGDDKGCWNTLQQVVKYMWEDLVDLLRCKFEME